jgi:hypothetical protein
MKKKELDELAAKDERRRRRSLKVTQTALLSLMGSPDGLARLRALTDDAWREAREADVAEEMSHAP